jgi:hypothetical protein
MKIYNNVGATIGRPFLYFVIERNLEVGAHRAPLRLKNNFVCVKNYSV